MSEIWLPSGASIVGVILAFMMTIYVVRSDERQKAAARRKNENATAAEAAYLLRQIEPRDRSEFYAAFNRVTAAIAAKDETVVVKADGKNRLVEIVS